MRTILASLLGLTVTILAFPVMAATCFFPADEVYQAWRRDYIALAARSLKGMLLMD